MKQIILTSMINYNYFTGIVHSCQHLFQLVGVEILLHAQEKVQKRHEVDQLSRYGSQYIKDLAREIKSESGDALETAVTYIDAWNITREMFAENVSGKTLVELPGRESMEVLTARVCEEKKHGSTHEHQPECKETRRVAAEE